jgi:hypothetical protein
VYVGNMRGIQLCSCGLFAGSKVINTIVFQVYSTLVKSKIKYYPGIYSLNLRNSLLNAIV